MKGGRIKATVYKAEISCCELDFEKKLLFVKNKNIKNFPKVDPS